MSEKTKSSIFLNISMAEKLFVIRKYIYAESAKEAIVKDRITDVDDVFVDNEWKKENKLDKDKDIGFKK